MAGNRFAFPVTLRPDKTDGGFVVTFKDFPEAITQGETVEQSLHEAEDCLEEAIAGRIRRQDDIPVPSKPKRNQSFVFVPAPMAAKAALYLAMKESGIDSQQLAALAGCSMKDIERLLNPKLASNFSLLQSALAVLGKRLTIHILDAA